MYVCSCFGITEEQVRAHAASGACTPRQIASQSGAGTDCGSCVRRIQGLLGRGGCPRREARLALAAAERVAGEAAREPAPAEPAVLAASTATAAATTVTVAPATAATAATPVTAAPGTAPRVTAAAEPADPTAAPAMA